jgi:origin recognition complex subunit 4
VRLNGFIHTDDKLALKEIWRQLGKEMQVEDDLVTRVSVLNTPWLDFTDNLDKLC